MTLDQRRRRLLLGIAIVSAAMVAFVVAAFMGPERHITIMSSWPLWPTLAVLVGQWARVRENIRVHGPDYLEKDSRPSRMVIAAAIGALIVVVAIGVALALRLAP